MTSCATTIMDYQALRLLGSVGAGQGGARRGRRRVGVDPEAARRRGRDAAHREHALEAAGLEGLIHPATSGPYAHMNLDHYFASWFERYAAASRGTIAGGTSEIQRNIIAQQVLGLPAAIAGDATVAIKAIDGVRRAIR